MLREKPLLGWGQGSLEQVIGKGGENMIVNLNVLHAHNPQEWEICSSCVIHNIGISKYQDEKGSQWIVETQEILTQTEYLMRMAEQNKADYEYLGMMLGVL